ncbi:hypothetical protein [Pseudonocardia sp. HH130630-07]|uniref:hypothetical protein n=1 Tax=Pseudonocardia sp. HH130630-07 TaxID=1690815 RepID=UPI000815243B|nr:hypothetical protein [Pseudonocardia sp. HH130630-07]ANY05000.1 hypothetical protein AFB00_00140 [Pseudonocardia sp. HH130630-07]
MTPLAEPGERGRLDVDPAVLRKIVEHAADTARSTRHRTRRLAGLDVGESGPSARVTARSSDQVDVRLRLTLVYPGAVRAAVADLRERVASDLLRMTGHRLHRFTVDVGALQSDTASAPETARVR